MHMLTNRWRRSFMNFVVLFVSPILQSRFSLTMCLKVTEKTQFQKKIIKIFFKKLKATVCFLYFSAKMHLILLFEEEEKKPQQQPINNFQSIK